MIKKCHIFGRGVLSIFFRNLFFRNLLFFFDLNLMKLYFQDTKKSPFDVEIDDTATIEDLKVKIAAEKNVEPSALKLIFHGRILDKSTIVSTIQSCSETNRIMCFIQNAKKSVPQSPPQKTAEPAPQAQPQPQTAAESAPQPAKPAPQTVEQTFQQSPPSQPSPYQQAQNFYQQPQQSYFHPQQNVSQPQHSLFQPQQNYFQPGGASPFQTPSTQPQTQSNQELFDNIMEQVNKIQISGDNVNTLLEFGYPRDLVEFALRISENDIEKASNLLADYDTMDKLKSYFLMQYQQVYSKTRRISSEGTIYLLHQICQNPNYFQSALQLGYVQLLDPTTQQQLLAKIDPQQLISFAIENGYATMGTDGNLHLRVQPNFSQQDIESYQKLEAEFQKLPKDQQDLCVRLSQQYRHGLAEVIQIFKACGCDEASTTAVLQSQ